MNDRNQESIDYTRHLVSALEPPKQTHIGQFARFAGGSVDLPFVKTNIYANSRQNQVSSCPVVNRLSYCF